MQDKLIITFASLEDEKTCSLIVLKEIHNNKTRLINNFINKEAENIYTLLTGKRKYKDIKTRNTLFDCINIYNNAYENANKNVLEEMMQYAFYENEEKIVVLDKEKLKQKYRVQDVIFEEDNNKEEECINGKNI